MKLNQRPKESFFAFAKRYIVKHRSIRPDHAFIQQGKADIPAVFKAWATQKLDPLEVTNQLLTELSQEGWLVLRKNKWTLKKSTKFCRYCATPINEVYFRSEKGARFCSHNCYENLYEIKGDEWDEKEEDPYWEDYLYLFEYFRELYPYHRIKQKMTTLKQMEPDDIAYLHIELLSMMSDLEAVFEEEAFIDVERFEGADGPVAEEMYRILKLLRKEEVELTKAEAIVRKKRGHIKKLYAIRVDSSNITSTLQQHSGWKNFKQKNKRYKVEDQFKWITSDISRRHRWYDELTSIFGYPADYDNLLQCPTCSRWEVSTFMKRQPDDFHYCEVCSDSFRKIFEKISMTIE